MRKLASEIARREGKKSQARIGDIREILGILCDILWESTAEDYNELNTTVNMMLVSGVNRAKKKK